MVVVWRIIGKVSRPAPCCTTVIVCKLASFGFMRCFSIDLVRQCCRCKNGHPFCTQCIGGWCVTNKYPTAARMISSETLQRLRRVATVDASNVCPVCRVVGPFRRDREIDAAQQVSNYSDRCSLLCILPPTHNHGVFYAGQGSMAPRILAGH